MKKLEDILDSNNIRYDESMKKHTTMKVGGNAKILVEPTKIEQIIDIINFAKENNMKYYIIGNGSNLVVADEGIDGIVIKLSSKFAEIRVEKEEIYTTAGVSMPYTAIIAKNNSLSGFEFAAGIPGTIGGGIKMNAGAYGGELSNVVKSITYLDEDGKIKTIDSIEAKFGYRDSIFKRNNNLVVLSAVFKLKKGDKAEIEKIMKENNESRKAKQPIEMPNAGSVFKRPVGHYVGPMIIECGMQGFSIGGAEVSKKHAGFIVNTGNATCNDIVDLIEEIKKKVYDKFQVELETEIQFIGGNF